MQHDGVRVPRPLQDAAAWLGCFDVVQLNEDEMRQLSPDPLSLAVDAIGAGTSLLIVTLAAKGAAYVAAPGFDGWAERMAEGRNGEEAERRNGGTAEVVRSGETPQGSLPPFRRSAVPPLSTLRTALIPAPVVDALDPTGCGDVFGAAAAARLFAGDPVESAIRHANAMASRNAAFRGAGGLSRHLRGELVTP
jgi:sugar/nucleoside kinase (ribokinase family)